MEYTVSELAKLVNGVVEGDANAKISKLTKIEEGEIGSLSFFANPKYEPYVYDTQASAIIVSKTFVPQKEVKSILIRTENPYSAFAKVLQFFEKQKKKNFKTPLFAKKIARTAKIGKGVYIGNYVSIGENVEIGDNCAIFPNVTILENVKIGNNVTIYPNVVIMNECVIGNNCNINAGAVIGADGFGFAPLENGEYSKIPQTGNVVIEDNVEVGANTCIDRATMGSTIIRRGAKLDNLIQVGHNVEVGPNTVIAGQTGVSGSTKIGEHCVIGGQVGVAGHITIAPNTTIGAQSGVSGTIKKEGLTWLGAPAIEVKNFRTSFIYYKNLDKLVKRIEDLEKELKNVKGE